jgi:hypothetical protein
MDILVQKIHQDRIQKIGDLMIKANRQKVAMYRINKNKKTKGK